MSLDSGFYVELMVLGLMGSVVVKVSDSNFKAALVCRFESYSWHETFGP